MHGLSTIKTLNDEASGEVKTQPVKITMLRKLRLLVWLYLGI